MLLKTFSYVYFTLTLAPLESKAFSTLFRIAIRHLRFNVKACSRISFQQSDGGNYFFFRQKLIFHPTLSGVGSLFQGLIYKHACFKNGSLK